MTPSNEDLESDEISALLEAMDEMVIVSLGASLSISNPTTSQVQALHDLGLNVPVGNVYDSLIVHRLLSESIDAALTVPAEAFQPASTKDLKAAEITHIIDSMTILGVSDVSDIITQITIPKLKALTAPQIEVLIEASSSGPNIIIYYMISDVVDPSNDLFPDADPNADEGSDINYVMDGFTRLRLKRASIAAALLLIP